MRVSTLVISTALVILAMLLLPLPHAKAATGGGQITAPTTGQNIQPGGAVKVAGTAHDVCKATITLTGPDGSQTVLDSRQAPLCAGTLTLGGSFTPTGAGAYQLTLKGDDAPLSTVEVAAASPATATPTVTVTVSATPTVTATTAPTPTPSVVMTVDLGKTPTPKPTATAKTKATPTATRTIRVTATPYAAPVATVAPPSRRSRRSWSSPASLRRRMTATR